MSGGNDLYSIKKKKENFIRDEFEKRLLKFAIKKSIPILAVCRGFQFVNYHFGGSFQKVNNHVKNHKITFKKFFFIKHKNVLTTNSFHNYSIHKLAYNFQNIAQTKDKIVEIAYAKNEKILCFMFHPERKNSSQSIINKLVFKYFGI